MRNIWTLFRSDLTRLFTNVVSVVIAVGLVVMPSIFAWYNIIACWDVFDNTGNLTVAVANTDEGYESDLVPLRVNVGEQVVSALRANEDIDWTFTTEEDAVDGAREGRYYAAVVIPTSFSRDMLTFYAEDMEHAEIVYYANEKKNAIAPKITDQGADSVSYQVNEVFAETLSEVALSLAQALGSYADDADADGRIAAMSSHVRAMADQVDDTAAVLALYGSLAQSASSLVEGSASLVSSAQGDLRSVTSAVGEGAGSVEGLIDALAASVDSLGAALDQTDAALAQVQANVDDLFAGADGDAGAAAANLRDQAAALDEQRAAYEQAARSVQALIDGGSVPEEYKPALKGAVGMLNAACDLIDATSESLRTAADKLEAGNANVQGEHDAVTAQIEQARSSVATLRATFGDEVRPAMDGLADEAGSFAASVAAGAARLNAAESDLSGSMGSATSSLSDAQGKISAMSSELGETSSKLRSFADSIDAALAAGDSEALREILTTDVEQFARALAAPVGVERVAVHPSENFGSAMAPLYTTIALFVGALLIMVVVKPTVSARAQEKLRDPKPRELFLGRFGVVALLSLAQTTLMGLGNMLFLQVQVAHPMLFMLCFWVAGLVFSSLIYAFVSAFANLGKAVAVLLLIIQVTGCGGSFPLQILPDFVQAISPFLPATHVVGAMRAAMFGTTGADFWVQIGELALFLIPAALIGLVLRKPFEKFMGWYIEKVEESKLIG